MKRSFDDLVRLMTRLRGPDGCPWDRKQTLPDLKPYVIEEAYEVVDAIDRDDRAALARRARRLAAAGGVHRRDHARGRIVRHLRLHHRDSRQARAPPSARVRRRRGERRGAGAGELGEAQAGRAEGGEQERALRRAAVDAGAAQGVAPDGESGARRLRLAAHGGRVRQARRRDRGAARSRRRGRRRSTSTKRSATCSSRSRTSRAK